MTFRDIFKSGFLARTAQLSVADMAVSMLLAFAIGLFIFYIYKKSYRGVMYSANFGTSLIAVALVTTFVMLAVTSNVVLSLGMVGALSIVRFRTAVKDPMDIAFLFWSLAAGIVLASGLVHLAVLGSLFIGIVMLVFSDRRDEERPYILVVPCADEPAARAARAPPPAGNRGAERATEAQSGANPLSPEKALPFQVINYTPSIQVANRK